MYSKADIVQKNLALRASTANPGFSVRQSEETIKNLRKENFNLKLKMYLMESKTNFSSQALEEDEASDKEFIDLFMENEWLRIELNDHQNLLKSSLDAIQKLEHQKVKYQKKYEDQFLKHQMQAVKTSKVRFITQ